MMMKNMCVSISKIDTERERERGTKRTLYSKEAIVTNDNNLY